MLLCNLALYFFQIRLKNLQKPTLKIAQLLHPVSFVKSNKEGKKRYLAAVVGPLPCLATALGPLACLAAVLGPLAWFT